MQYLLLHGVVEAGWDALAPRIHEPARPRLPQVLEEVLGIGPADAARAAAEGTAPEPPTPAPRVRMSDAPVRSLEETKALLAQQQRRSGLVAAMRARAMAPRDAWRALAPPEWLVDPHRHLVGEKQPRDAPAVGLPLRAAWTSWRVEREAPEMESVLALCSDPAGVVAAEAAAREACARMASWGVKPARDVVWFVEPEVRLMTYLDTFDFRAHADAALGLSPARLADGERMIEARNPPRDAWRAEWAALAKRDLTRRNAWNDAARVGQTLDSRNPFAPILEIWRLGYALLAVLDGHVVLAAASPGLDGLLETLVEE